MIKKIAVIVGHSPTDPGAIGWNKFHEFDYNSMVASTLKSELIGKEIKVFYRGKTGIWGVAASVMLYKPDLSIELHLNASSNKAYGCEVLCLEGDKASEAIGKSFASVFTARFGRKIRGDMGIKSLSSKLNRGFINLSYLKLVPRKILVEPFFLSNKEEWIEPLTYADFLITWLKGI